MAGVGRYGRLGCFEQKGRHSWLRHILGLLRNEENLTKRSDTGYIVMRLRIAGEYLNELDLVMVANKTGNFTSFPSTNDSSVRDHS